MLETLLPSKITLQLVLDKALLMTSVDKSLLEDVLLNISINALHAMPSGGQLQIKTENTILSDDDKFSMPFQAGQYVKLTLEDNGCGMSDEVISHIFEPFYTTKGNVGHGLGLSQCYGFVKSSKGVITVDSLIKKGPIFTIYLPVSEGEAIAHKLTETNEKSSGQSAGKLYSFKIVDDENQICLLNSAVLKSAGFMVYGL